MIIKILVFPEYSWDPLIIFWFGESWTSIIVYCYKKDFQNRSLTDGEIGERKQKTNIKSNV